jgi:hypothetical protein
MGGMDDLARFALVAGHTIGASARRLELFKMDRTLEPVVLEPMTGAAGGWHLFKVCGRLRPSRIEDPLMGIFLVVSLGIPSVAQVACDVHLGVDGAFPDDISATDEGFSGQDFMALDTAVAN